MLSEQSGVTPRERAPVGGPERPIAPTAGPREADPNSVPGVPIRGHRPKDAEAPRGDSERPARAVPQRNALKAALAPDAAGLGQSLGALDDAGLLALVLGLPAGSPTARRLLRRFGRLCELPSRSAREIAAVAGLGQARAQRLLAALELGLRATHEFRPGDSVCSSRDVYRRLRRLAVLRRETFWLVALDTRHRVLCEVRAAEGALAHCAVTPRDVFRPLLQEGAAAAIAVHNHPSGDPTPSPDDLALTERLVEAGRLLGVPLLDHVIIGAGTYRSLHDTGFMGASALRAPSNGGGYRSLGAMGAAGGAGAAGSAGAGAGTAGSAAGAEIGRAHV